MMTQEQLKKDVLVFLRENYTAVVATSFNDMPKASTVYYYVDNNFNFYFITKRNTSKYLNIEMNPRAAVVVGTGPEHISVQASGYCKLIVDDEEKAHVIDHIIDIRAREHVKIWPIEEIEKFKYKNKVVFQITPEQIVFMNLDSTLHPDSIAYEYMDIL
ncbi:MAG: hypothetical protein K0S38_1013 [Candidatus Paceibacter sp.]|jgi:nitroimidazol reductase NimA-like FMN-containing flavoprotein (pyridoxamine 5'-phosphate oxidase superfamily)|nr:hypothetical protein [Candidatus Paceibacter sp.]